MKKLRIITLLFISWFLLHISLTVFDGLNDDIKRADVGIVLGNKVELNGEPSPRLKSRLDKAVELYNRDFFDRVIVSGGRGKEGFDEAEVMRDYLAANNIPLNAIMMDNNGSNSYLTAVNSKKIMNAEGFASALIITQYYHISRTNLAFYKLGVTSVYSAHADIFEFRDAYSLMREFFGFYKYLLRGSLRN